MSDKFEVHPLVKELYEKVPEYSKISDGSYDEFGTVPFGILSLILFDEIMDKEELSKIIKSSFEFFNEIGDRNDPEIDNVLIVEIYEGLYSKKKCNDIARSLLRGRNKEVYEY
jgi:hypothetical protein